MPKAFIANTVKTKCWYCSYFWCIFICHVMTAFSRLCLGKNIQLNLEIRSISKSYHPRPVYLRILLKTLLYLAQRPQLYLLSSLLRLCHIQPNLQTCKPAFPTYPSSAPLFRLSNILHQNLTSYSACLLQEEEVLIYYFIFWLYHFRANHSAQPALLGPKTICIYPSSTSKSQSHTGPIHLHKEAAKPWMCTVHTQKKSLSNPQETLSF